MERKGKSKNFDPQVTASNSYNDPAGAQKNVDVGAKLKPIQIADMSWTTDATTARQVPAGTQLMVYNNAGAVGSVRFGQDSSVVSGAAGAVDANGNVAIPCKPNDWTLVASSTDTWVVTSAATLLVFIIDDHTTMK